MANNLKAERTLTAEELRAAQDKLWYLVNSATQSPLSYAVVGQWAEQVLDAARSQSLSTQQPMGEVRVKPLEWQFIDGGRNISFWRAPNPLGGLPFEATSQEQMKQREDRYRSLVLSALHPNQESGE